MAVIEKKKKAPGCIEGPEDWYEKVQFDAKNPQCYSFTSVTPAATALMAKYRTYKNETEPRYHGFDKLLRVADAKVSKTHADLPNVSSGDAAGMVRRMARNLVQNTPNVEIQSIYDDDSEAGVFTSFILKSRIIGDDIHSNVMQQNLFASTKTALTLGFDTVIPRLCQDATGTWKIKYDTIYYANVFPEPGAKSVHDANDVFIRRYLTEGDIKALIRDNVVGWDQAALRKLLKNGPQNHDFNALDHRSKEKGVHHPQAYEIITWYSSGGDHFLTFNVRDSLLLRVEKNTHPFKQHPVKFLVLEKDENQPFGKSQVELIFGRHEFQDLLLNGSMKQWIRNINPAIIAFGGVNTAANFSPGSFTNISNPNARIEPLQLESQTLNMFGSISQQNSGNMGQLIGAADQQMAAQSTGGMMSQTPQGVQAQQALVDITTNNYQKAIESFFSDYCSYALTLYFAELKGAVKVQPTADVRQALIGAGMNPEDFDEDGVIKDLKYEDLAKCYNVRVVPGSLVELEDEKQIRLLNQMFIPLSQALPALAQTGDQEILQNASLAMQFIIKRQLELSGSSSARELTALWETGKLPDGSDPAAVAQAEEARNALIQREQEQELRMLEASQVSDLVQVVASMQEQMAGITEVLEGLVQRVGGQSPTPNVPGAENPEAESPDSF